MSSADSPDLGYEQSALDILREVAGVAFGQAAEALSDLVGTHVDIEVPEIYLREVTSIPSLLDNEVRDTAVYLSQAFTGTLVGWASLIYSRDSAVALLEAACGPSTSTQALSRGALATLQELGNILLGACLSALSDLVDADLQMSISEASVQRSTTYLQSLVDEYGEITVALVFHNTIMVKERKIRGHLLVYVGVQDLDRIIHRTSARWGER